MFNGFTYCFNHIFIMRREFLFIIYKETYSNINGYT